ncbi:proline iminopeptidase-family hydrolase [Actinocrispum wychmicini]|uniref:Proline iminopeptidase n=1 Tax=Actinocrispum wychmicini TaxID=1213861 RepID=A0A4R2JC02_9PSEU|nr:proline iminopeptidase-family hydrolase [Actinocrispum wychmicini]TCO54258.1 L-proline amide hydrolase [Actinocrispum wychmicini]
MAAAVTEGTAKFGDHQTWYRITGELSSDQAPLVVLHGGPGCVHDYLLPVAAIAETGRPVIHYDQLGNGRSTHLPDKPSDFWTVQLFLDELQSLVDTLRIAEEYLVLGQSWGGMLAAEHATLRPAGLRGLVISDSPADMRLWSAAAAELRAALPPGVDDTLRAHEEAGTTDSEEYRAAMRVFYERHVCRVVPWPDEFERTLAAIDEDPTVYSAMNGPSEFHVTGSLRDWSIIDRLGAIDVPTLIISGEFDEATPATVQPYQDNIADSRWEILANCSHLPQLEDTERFNTLVADFLDSCDHSGGTT